MPITFQFRPAEQLVEVRLSGEIASEEMLGAIDVLASRPEFAAATRMLSDHRELARAGSLDQVEMVLQRMRGYGARFGETRWAIVTTLPESYGMMRVLSTLAEMRNSMQVEVFTDMESALRWLSLPAPISGPA